MNNSFERLIDGMCATLRGEVLTRLTDEFARGQVFGVINLLNTFKVRADWSADFLLQQIAAQSVAIEGALALLRETTAAAVLSDTLRSAAPAATPIDDLLAQRDDGNRAIGALLGWLDAERDELAPATIAAVEQLLRTAMRAEAELELKHSPRPLFAEMSSGREN